MGSPAACRCQAVQNGIPPNFRVLRTRTPSPTTRPPETALSRRRSNWSGSNSSQQPIQDHELKKLASGARNSRSRQRASSSFRGGSASNEMPYCVAATLMFRWRLVISHCLRIERRSDTGQVSDGSVQETTGPSRESLQVQTAPCGSTPRRGASRCAQAGRLKRNEKTVLRVIRLNSKAASRLNTTVRVDRRLISICQPKCV